jgi:prepilin-type N-terminal cleavage/methylation domain-containing protein
MMIRQPKQLFPPETQSGFTIIECLLAIILVSILLTAIAPVIALSVATRVQARRVEQATQAAKSYIDGVRAGKIEAPPSITNTVLVKSDKTNDVNNYLFTGSANAAAPVGTAAWDCNPADTNNPNNSYCQTSAGTAIVYCIGLDDTAGCSSGSSRDFIIQPFRSVVPDASGSAPDPSDDGSKGYLLGVRVYRADALDGSITLQTAKPVNNVRAAAYTGGAGNRSLPLVEMTTEIRGGRTDYSSFCDRLGCNTSNPATPP